MSEPDSQPGLRTPRAGAVTEEQRALSPIALEVSHTGDRFKSLSAKLDAATLDRDFAGAYLDLCEEIDDLKGALNGLKTKLRERAKAAIAARDAQGRQTRRGPPER